MSFEIPYWFDKIIPITGVDKKFQENYAGKMNYTSFEKEIIQFSAVIIEEKGPKTASNKKNILEKKTLF